LASILTAAAARACVLLAGAGSVATGQVPGAASPRTVTVRMIDQGPYGMAFDPTRVTVHHGDTVQFVQAGNLPHNVAFKSVPTASNLGALRVGPLLTVRGETFAIVIDGRFAVGKHVYVCPPHEVLGMAGIVYVVDGPE